MFIEVLLITLVYLQVLTRVANDSYLKTIEVLYHFYESSKESDFFDKICRNKGMY